MRFEVLGPVTVRTADGAPVPVPEAKVRALLADLLVHHGRPVPVDRLIDDLWGDSPPGNPGNTLQTKVSQLRRALERAEDGARALVAYGPAGYVLRVPDGDVDAGRFAELTARARLTGEPRVRAALLSDGLALWRGPAYADFRDAGFTRAAIGRLEEERLTALEELAELRLEFGEHSRLADELAPLVAEHPMRERLRAAQLRALYRAGRQSEALAAYRELERWFAQELGIDPGAELAALHGAILRQDPELDLPAAPVAPAFLQAPAATRRSVPAARPRGGLPVPATPLIGRDEEVARVCALLGTDRLVTLTGPGGVGKTRLALAAAARLEGPATGRTGPATDPADAFPDGVRLVELAGARGTVAETVAAALGVRDENGEGPYGPPENADENAPESADEGTDGGDVVEQRLAEVLAARRTLLVLDNCEHLVGPVAALVSRLLRRAAGLRVLVTSQEPLAVAGEVLHAVAPLEEAAAMELFAARAAAAAPGFALGAENRDAVALVCRRLDGIPLALELAATRVRTLGVHALAQRLHDRFRLLNQAHRDAPSRQRTLRAMIDWSWELLPPPERAVLRRLSVFSGGFALESAEAVCADDALPAEDVLDLLTRLVDRSLVVVTTTGDGDAEGPRYRMLESVLAYGLERLDEAAETGATRHRHAAHHTELAERAAAKLHGPDQRDWLRRLDREALNLRAALDHALADGRPLLALRLVTALTWYWHLRGRVGEAVKALGRTLAAAEGGPRGADGPSAPLVATARVWHTALALLTGDLTLDRTGPGSWPDALAVADPRGRWLLAFARCGFGADRSELASLTEEFRALGDRWGEAAALSTRATHALYDGDLDALRRHAGRSAAIFTELGDRWGQLYASEQLGVLAEIAGDYPEAFRLYGEGARSAEELELWTHASFQLARLGRVALLTGDDARATEYHERAVRLAAEHSHRPAEQFAATGLALGERRRGELDAAEVRLLPWLEWNRRNDVHTGTALILAQLGYAAEQRGDVRRAETLHLDGLAAARRTRDPRALALAVEGLAGVRSLASDHERAASLLGAAAALRESVGSPLPPAERHDVDRAVRRSRPALGAAAFEAAFARGRAVPVEEQLRGAVPPGGGEPADNL
ncbi:AfsR/SARP family transcriptional regulator [Kitasatospora sp. NPDC004240]